MAQIIHRIKSIIPHMKIYKNIFEKIIALDNLFLAWDEFKKNKKQHLAH